jgi:hypothetical protein
MPFDQKNTCHMGVFEGLEAKGRKREPGKVT